jgi:hypothetical protein
VGWRGFFSIKRSESKQRGEAGPRRGTHDDGYANGGGIVAASMAGLVKVMHISTLRMGRRYESRRYGVAGPRRWTHDDGHV